MYIPDSKERGFESSIKLAPNRAQLCGEQASGTSNERADYELHEEGSLTHPLSMPTGRRRAVILL